METQESGNYDGADSSSTFGDTVKGSINDFRITKNSSSWNYFASTIKVPAVRTGWLGVWDAIKSALKKETRLTHLSGYNIEYWAKFNGERKFDIDDVKVAEQTEQRHYVDGYLMGKPTAEEFLAIWEDNHYTASIYADVIWEMAIKSKH
jgi:hypothetical protein